jgi:hypothetical protein
MATGVTTSPWRSVQVKREPESAPRADSLTTLELRDNVVREKGKEEQHVERLHIRPYRCRCRICPLCGPDLGYRVRGRLLASRLDWKIPYMLTLTVDRARFACPEEAWKVISGNRYVSRLLHLLGVERWVWVLEFQMKSGEGWPHWHVLMDLATVGGYVNLKLAWHMWKHVWKVGGLKLSKDKFAKRRDVDGAMRYITKYIVKQPAEGWPAWILDQRNMKFYQPSRSVGSLVRAGEQNHVHVGEVQGEEEERTREGRPLLERVAGCRKASAILHSVGSLGYRYIDQIPIRPGALALAAVHGWGEQVELRTHSNEWGKSRLEVSIRLRPRESVETVIDRLRRLAQELEIWERDSKYQTPHPPEGFDECAEVWDGEVCTPDMGEGRSK